MDLGIVVTIENPNESEANFARAKEAGFDKGLVYFSWRPVTATLVRHVALAAKNQGFETIAVGSGSNLLRLADTPAVSTDESDMMTLAENMAMLDGCSKLMVWSGSYARKWSEPNLLNQGEDAYFAMVFEIHRILGRLSGIPFTLMLQPCYAHILHDVATCLRLTDDFETDKVCLALDIAYMVAPTMYAKHPQMMPQLISALAPVAEMALISDLSIKDTEISYPLPGRGVLNLPAVMTSLTKALPPEKPVLLNTRAATSVRRLNNARIAVTEAMSA